MRLKQNLEWPTSLLLVRNTIQRYTFFDDSLANALTLQDTLYTLRSETQDAFDEAKSLEVRWKELEKEQRDVYQVRLL